MHRLSYGFSKPQYLCVGTTTFDPFRLPCNCITLFASFCTKLQHLAMFNSLSM